jgi:hypothetical protein
LCEILLEHASPRERRLQTDLSTRVKTKVRYNRSVSPDWHRPCSSNTVFQICNGDAIFINRDSGLAIEVLGTNATSQVFDGLIGEIEIRRTAAICRY